jgi:WD40 repeat protein
MGGLAFSPEGKTLAMWVWGDDSIRLWDVATQRERVTVADPSGFVAFSPDGRHLAVGGMGGSVKVWNADSGKLEATLLEGEGGLDTAVSFSPDGKTVASGSGYSSGTVRLWDVDSGELRASFKGHAARITCLAFFPDGKTLATGSFDATVKLWDVATGQERVTLKGHTAPIIWFVIAPDGNLLASASTSGPGSVKIWRAATDPDAPALKADVDPDDPVSPVAQNNLGDRLRAEGRLKEAEAAYRQAKVRLEKLLPGFPNMPAYRHELARSHLNLGSALENQGKLDEAIDAYDGFVELEPGADYLNAVAWPLVTRPEGKFRDFTPPMRLEITRYSCSWLWI